MKKRIEELDYLKCIFITLMIIFHLVYIGDKYPYIKKLVYTFHMPAFLIISGYLVNIQKDIKSFLRTMLWIFLPYMVMEIGYVGMSAILPVREKVAEVTFGILLHKVFLAPMGPYWYLHTLVFCGLSYYFVFKYLKTGFFAGFVLLGVWFFICSSEIKLLTFSNAVYFLAGAALRCRGKEFVSVFFPSLWSLLPFILLCCFPENLDRATLAGVAITYLAISLFLFLYRYLPARMKEAAHFIGRNTLVILLFSPVFTILSKTFLPLFSFDSSGFCFMSIAVIFTLTGCLSIAWCIDKMNLAKFCFGTERILQ